MNPPWKNWMEHPPWWWYLAKDLSGVLFFVLLFLGALWVVVKLAGC